MLQFGISYVKKDNGPDNVDGWNLFVKYIKAWSEDHVEFLIRKIIPEENIRSIWREDD